MKNNKALIIVPVLLVVVVSAFELWFRKGAVEEKAFQAGAASIISEVVGRTISACEPLNLFVGDQEVNLVNVSCLGQKKPENTDD